MAWWKIAKMTCLEKPCKYCGSEDVYLWNDAGTNYFIVECDKCDVDFDVNVDLDMGQSLYDLKKMWDSEMQNRDKDLEEFAREWLNSPIPADLMADLADMLEDEDYKPSEKVHQIVWRALRWGLENEHANH